MREVKFKVTEMFPGCGSSPWRPEGFSIGIRVKKALGIENGSISNNDVVAVIDFEGVERITIGFADEIIGTFIRENGIDLSKSNHLNFINTNDNIDKTINEVRENPEDSANFL